MKKNENGRILGIPVGLLLILLVIAMAYAMCGMFKPPCTKNNDRNTPVDLRDSTVILPERDDAIVEGTPGNLDTVTTDRDTVVMGLDTVIVGADIISKVRRGISNRDAKILAKLIYDAAAISGQIDYPFLLAVIEAESKFNIKAVSPAGAVGLGQLMPGTAERLAKKLGIKYNRDMLGNPAYNIKLSVHYLERLSRLFPTRMLVAAAYNGGPGGARKYRKWADGEASRETVHTETIAYVEKVMKNYTEYCKMLQ